MVNVRQYIAHIWRVLCQMFDNPYIGQAQSGRRQVGWTPDEWCLGDIWIVWVVQKLTRRPPDVCDALPDIGRFIGGQFAMLVLSPS